MLQFTPDVADVVLSGVAIFYAVYVNKLSRRLARIEEAREKDRVADRKVANIRLQYGQPASNFRSITVTNHGPGRATKIRGEIDGVQFSEHDAKLSGERLTETLSAGSSDTVRLLPLLMGGGGVDPNGAVFACYWENEDGSTGDISIALKR